MSSSAKFRFEARIVIIICYVCTIATSSLKFKKRVYNTWVCLLIKPHRLLMDSKVDQSGVSEIKDSHEVRDKTKLCRPSQLRIWQSSRGWRRPGASFHHTTNCYYEGSDKGCKPVDHWHHSCWALGTIHCKYPLQIPWFRPRFQALDSWTGCKALQRFQNHLLHTCYEAELTLCSSNRLNLTSLRR